MADQRYEIDDEGNLIGPQGAVGGSAEPVSANGAESNEDAITRAQAQGTVRALILSEVVGVLLLLGGAVYYEDVRTLLLAVAAVYAVFAVVMVRFMRRSLEKRIDEPLG